MTTKSKNKRTSTKPAPRTKKQENPKTFYKKAPVNNFQVEENLPEDGVYTVKMYIQEEYKSKVLDDEFVDTIKDSFDFSIYHDSKHTISITANSVDIARAVANIFEYIYRAATQSNNEDNFNELFLDELDRLIDEALTEVGQENYVNCNKSIFKDVKGRYVVPRTENQEYIVESIRTNVITVVKGCAGTGKTKIAVCMALKFLFNNRFDKILIVRPMLTVGKDIGFLPGTVDEKYGPFASPISETFIELIGEEHFMYLIDKKKIEMAPVAFVRGANFKSSIVIIDEAQNMNKTEIITLLTRLCYNGKIIITGDESQDDRKNQNLESGLTVVCDKLGDMDGIGVVKMDIGDIQRHSMLKEVIERFAE